MFHRKLATRLGAVGLIVAAVFGGLAWLSQGERIAGEVTDRAVQGTRAFNEQINALISSAAWRDKGDVDRELKAFVRDRSRIFRDRNGHFIYVAVFDPDFGPLASVVDEAYPRIGALKATSGELARKLREARDDLYQVHRLDGIPFILTATPLVDGAGNTMAYVETIFAVSPEALRAARTRIAWTVLGVIGIVLATTLLLYPTIVLLTRRLGQTTVALLDSNLATLEVLGSAIAKRDSDTDAHNYRVTLYATHLAEAVGLDPRAVQGLIKGAFLHDVGKIGVRDGILLKPGALDDDEFEIMKTHVRHGLDIVKRSAWLKDAIDVVGYHHEKYDGRGYYEGLAGKEIPIRARIFAIADVFDALTSKRPYKKPFPFEKAMSILEKDKGAHFDPALVDAFARIAPDLYRDVAGLEGEALKTRMTSIVEKYYAEDAEISLPE